MNYLYRLRWSTFLYKWPLESEFFETENHFLEIQYICQCKWTQKRYICKPCQGELLRRCNRCFPGCKEGLVCFSRPTWNCFVQRQHHPHKSTSSIIDAFSGNLLHQLAHFHKGVILFQADDNLPLNSQITQEERQIGGEAGPRGFQLWIQRSWSCR